MAQSVSEFPFQLTTLLKKLTLGKKIALLILVGSTISGFIFVMTWAGRPDFRVLYANLNPEDAGAILTELKSQKIQYQLSSGGNSILVPEERIYELRMELASQGLPQGGGVGFEIFDNTSLGMTLEQSMDLLKLKVQEFTLLCRQKLYLLRKRSRQRLRLS